MMRIAHVTSGLDRRAAGVGAVVEALSAEQHAKGHDVRVFGLDSPDWAKSDMLLWRGAPAEAFRTLGWPRSFGYAPGLARALSCFEPEIVHLHGLWMYPAVAVLHWHLVTSRPYVYSPHGMLSPVALSFSTRKKHIARTLFQNKALTQATMLHATAEAEAEELRHFGLTNPVSVVPLGINFAAVPTVVPGRSKRILALGRIHPVKNLGTLIEAWGRLETKFPGWSLEIVGPDEGGHRAELQALTARLHVQRVIFESAVLGPDRDACMAAADIFVLPTKSENFALTVAESLMMETPVIATHGAPWPGLVHEGCGWWIEQGIDPLVAALESAMSLTDEKRRAMGKRGRAWMLRDYTWPKVADRILAVYDDAISLSG
ncbi:MAG: hypothetical protein RLZZ444_2668 [Pseudomonadota bacterium]|jgi:glycosyltransferase involved in cell wall biosynthesis